MLDGRPYAVTVSVLCPLSSALPAARTVQYITVQCSTVQDNIVSLKSGEDES